jgi:tetratricopeptide (TPR) repeat protein
MEFALEHDLTLALRLVGRLPFFLYLRGGFDEARGWLDAILPRAAGQPLDLLGRAHVCAAAIAERVGDVDGQARHSEEAYAAFAAAGDERGLADALRERGKTASARGDTAQQDAIHTELAAHAERIGDRWNGAIALNNLGNSALQSGDWERVVELCGRSAALRRELGDEWGTALALCNVACAEVQLGRLSSAASTLRDALGTSVRVVAKTIAIFCLDVAVDLAVARGAMREAARLAGASSQLLEELGMARDALDRGFFERAVESIHASLGCDADAEIQRGRELSLDEAAAIALAVTADLD